MIAKWWRDVADAWFYLRRTLRLVFYRQVIPPPTVWHVDRDGRVRTNNDRPVVLRGARIKL